MSVVYETAYERTHEIEGVLITVDTCRDVCHGVELAATHTFLPIPEAASAERGDSSGCTRPKPEQKADSPHGGPGVLLTTPLGTRLPGRTSEVMAKHSAERCLTRAVGAPE